VKLTALLYHGISLVSRALARALPALAVPRKQLVENSATACRVQSPTEPLLAVPAQTDLFITPAGEFRVDRSPRVVFRPEGPFILTAKIRPEFRHRWDASVLVLYNDSESFAKFCFEHDFQGAPRVVSVVCDGTGDHCNSYLVPDGAIYFRIAGSSERNTFGFYVSSDGRQWFPIQGFRLPKTDNLQVGLSAQSPYDAGDGCAMHFFDIDVQRREVKDFWKGD